MRKTGVSLYRSLDGFIYLLPADTFRRLGRLLLRWRLALHDSRHRLLCRQALDDRPRPCDDRRFVTRRLEHGRGRLAAVRLHDLDAVTRDHLAHLLR